MYYWQYDYQLFKLEFFASEKGLTNIKFVTVFQPHKKEFNPSVFKDIHHFIQSYLDKKPIKIDIPLDYAPTQFQKKIYDEALKIPFGEVITYKELAQRIDNPNAVRAAGGALGKNPFPLYIPCHRIIGSNGKMTGFSAEGGIVLKEILLNYEK